MTTVFFLQSMTFSSPQLFLFDAHMRLKTFIFSSDFYSSSDSLVMSGFSEHPTLVSCLISPRNHSLDRPHLRYCTHRFRLSPSSFLLWSFSFTSDTLHFFSSHLKLL